MFFFPRGEETAPQVPSPSITALATLGGGRLHAHGRSSTYDQAPEKLQFHVNETWIPVINSRYIVGLDGMGLPLYLLSMVITVLVIIYSVEPHPGPGNPKAFLADAGARRPA